MASLETPHPQQSATNLVQAALSYQRQEQWRKAAQYYQQALLLRPDWPEVHYRLGVVLEKQEHFTTAIQCYRRAIALNSDYFQAYYSLGIILQKQGKLHTAIKCYKKAIQLNPTEPNLYSNLGCTLSQQGQFKEAIELLEDAIRRFPENAVLYNNLAYALFTQGKLDQAINYYLQAVQFNADLIDAQINLGTAFQKQGLHTVAIRYFQQVLEQKPESITVRSRYGWSLLEQNQIQEALQQFRQVIAQQPEFVEAYIQWLDVIEDTDELNRSRIACGRFLQALLQDINSPDVYQNLAQTYFYLGNALIEYRNYAQAEAYYQKAIKIKPNWLQPYLHLGRCFAKQAQLSAAITTYRQGLSIQPESVELQQQLEQTIQQQQKLKENAGKLTQNSVKIPADAPITNSNLPPCAGLECQPCLNRLFGQFEPINLGNGIYRCSQQPPDLEQNPPNQVAIIPQGRTWIAPRKNWWNVCNAIATIHPNDQLDTTFSRFYPAPLPNCQNPDFSQHQVFFLDEFPPLKDLEGKIAVLSGLSGNVYFHWMVDVLPRLEILKQQGIDLAEIDGFVVNSIQRPFQRETLEKLGIPLSKIIESDQQSYLQAEELIVPAFASTVGWVSPWIIEFHRQLFTTAIHAPDVDYPERIYVTRKKAQYRRIFNESEVIECLKQYGFETVELETISVEQQAALFAHAKVIIAPHGAGLTNLMFCRPETQVIELISPHYLRFYYWTIALQLDLEFYYILGEAFNCSALRSLMYQNPLTEDIFISIETLKKALQRLGLSDNIKLSLNYHNTDLILERSQSQVMVMASSKLPELPETTFSNQAKAYLKQGNLEATYQLCIEALQQQPEFAPAYKFLGDVFRLKKQWKESRKSYSQAIRLQPDFAEAHANLGSLYAVQKQWQKAIFCYQNGIAYQPESAEIYRNLARVWEKVNQSVEAADCWYEVYRLEPESATATDHCQLGQKLLQQSQITKAIFCFEQALQQDNSLEAAQIGLRQAQQRRQSLTAQPRVTLPPQPTEDIKARAIEEIVTVETLPQASSVPNPSTSQILERAIDLEQAQPQQEALPTATESLQLDVATLLQQAHQHYQNQQYEPTSQLCQQILQANPPVEETIDTHVLLGKAQQGMRQTQQAIDSYKAALTLQPGNITAYNNLGSCYALLKQWKNAIGCYQKAIQLQPDLAVAYQNLGRVWKRMGQIEKYADCFYQAFQIEPELGSADEYHALGNTLLQQGKREQAQNCYCRTLDLNPEHPEAHHNLGELLSTQKQWEDAMAHYRRAIELKPDSFASYNSLGKAYMAMGDLEEALSCYNQAVRLKPELLLAAQNLTAATATAKSKPILAQQLPAPTSAQPTEDTPDPPLVKVAPQFDVMGRLTEAETYYQKQRYDLCIHACRQVVQWQPKAAAAYLLWGKALTAQADHTRAQQFYQQAIALQPKDPEAYIELGNLYSQQQQWQEAVSQYQTALQQQPTAAAYHQLAQAYQALGEVEAAQMSLYEALHLEPETGSLQDYQTLAEAFWKREEWTPAMGCYQQVLVRDPQQAIAHQRLAEGFQQAGELDKALIHYRQAYEIVAAQQSQPVEPLATPSVEMPEDGEMAMLLVHVPSFSKKGKWLLGLLDRMKWATILAWTKPEEFPSFNPDSSHQTVLSEVPQLPPLPQKLIAASQPSSAVLPALQFTATPEETPDRKVVPFPSKAEAATSTSSPDSILRQAQVDLKTGHWQECQAACRQVLAQNPKQFEAYKLLGKVLQAQGQVSQALQAYGNAMALQPLDVDVKVSMGDLFIQQQQWNKAIACYQAAVKQNPHLNAVWDKLGDIWAKHKQVEKAIAAYKQVIQLSPQHLPVYQKLGNLLQQQGQVEAANAVYQQAKQLAKK